MYEEDKLIIYQIQNKITKQLYIGYSTKFNSNKLFQKSSYWGSGIRIQNAIKKYGKEEFERKVLLKNIFDFEELQRYERLWIKKKNSKKPNGYNLTDGGRGRFGDKASKETRQKLKKSRKKYWETHPEAKEKMSKKMQGENNPFFKKKHSEKTKQKMKENHWDCSGVNNPWYGKHLPEEMIENIRQINKGKHYSPKTEFQKGHNYNKPFQTIDRICLYCQNIFQVRIKVKKSPKGNIGELYPRTKKFCNFNCSSQYRKIKL